MTPDIASVHVFVPFLNITLNHHKNEKNVILKFYFVLHFKEKKNT